MKRYEGSMANSKRGGTRDNGIGGGDAGADLATGGTSRRHSDHAGSRPARCEEDLSGHIGWTRILIGGRGSALATAEPNWHRPGRRSYAHSGGLARFKPAVRQHLDAVFGRRRRVSQ